MSTPSKFYCTPRVSTISGRLRDCSSLFRGPRDDAMRCDERMACALQTAGQQRFHMPATNTSRSTDGVAQQRGSDGECNSGTNLPRRRVHLLLPHFSTLVARVEGCRVRWERKRRGQWLRTRNQVDCTRQKTLLHTLAESRGDMWVAGCIAIDKWIRKALAVTQARVCGLQPYCTLAPRRNDGGR
ncbi:hypothetical protein CC80DRAFT_287067 [Byssothecium circinans]|uniref:Uncharacterized protein n=1 Tax=Byssothecium circinans TaxID=147558 RepID=A0A6A5U845_9PLEO|nr:hypothetical protein CC80DRAFT_287067 [Byssothecium circinans]